MAGSICAAQAAAFRRELCRTDRVWTLIGEGQYIASHKPDGTRAMPFWSRESRAERIASRAEGILLGINWSGEQAVGYDVTAATMAAWFPDLITTEPGPDGSPAARAVVSTPEAR